MHTSKHLTVSRHVLRWSRRAPDRAADLLLLWGRVEANLANGYAAILRVMMPRCKHLGPLRRWVVASVRRGCCC